MKNSLIDPNYKYSLYNLFYRSEEMGEFIAKL